MLYNNLYGIGYDDLFFVNYCNVLKNMAIFFFDMFL